MKPETNINEMAGEAFISRIEEATKAARDAEESALRLRDGIISSRLKLAAFWVVAVVVAITLHDEHVHRCMVVQPQQTVHPACDFIFPFHDHQEIQDNLLLEIERVQQEGRGVNDGED